jgi:uncharacterized protein (TIGR02996 family)
MPTDEQRAFWNAIRANPDEDTPRLVYADWLQEHGDEPRAEFIRVQCALERLPHDRRKNRTERKRLQARNQELQEAHRDEWLAPLVEAVTDDPVERKSFAHYREFTRGFVGYVYLNLKSGARLAESGHEPEPIRYLEVTRRAASDELHHVAAVARWPFGSCLHTLSLGGATDEEVIAVVVGGRLTNLVRLDFWWGTVTDVGVVALARSPLLASVRSLTLSENRIGDAGARALAVSPHLSPDCEIRLSANPIGDDALALLSARFPRFRRGY